MCICIYFSNLLSIQYLWHKLRITSYDKKWLKVSSAFKKGIIIYSCESLGTYRLHWTSEVALKRGKVGSVCGFGISAVDLFLDYMYIKSKLSFVGISQADPAGLQKAPRWAKMWSKGFQTKTCLDFVILSLSLSLSLSIYIYIYIYPRLPPPSPTCGSSFSDFLSYSLQQWVPCRLPVLHFLVLW